MISTTGINIYFLQWQIGFEHTTYPPLSLCIQRKRERVESMKRKKSNPHKQSSTVSPQCGYTQAMITLSRHGTKVIALNRSHSLCSLVPSRDSVETAVLWQDL